MSPKPKRGKKKKGKKSMDMDNSASDSSFQEKPKTMYKKKPNPKPPRPSTNHETPVQKDSDHVPGLDDSATGSVGFIDDVVDDEVKDNTGALKQSDLKMSMLSPESPGTNSPPVDNTGASKQSDLKMSMLSPESPGTSSPPVVVKADSAYTIPEGSPEQNGKGFMKDPATVEDLDAEGTGNVWVKVCEVKDVTKMDLLGQADPFFTLTIGHTEKKTTQKSNCQQAVFNEEFSFDKVPKDAVLKIEGFDGDMFNDPEVFGIAEVGLTDSRSSWIELEGHGKKKGQGITARVKLIIIVDGKDSGAGQAEGLPAAPFQETGDDWEMKTLHSEVVTVTQLRESGHLKKAGTLTIGAPVENTAAVAARERARREMAERQRQRQQQDTATEIEESISGIHTTVSILEAEEIQASISNIESAVKNLEAASVQVSQAECGKAVPGKESPAQVLAASRSREDSSAATGTHQTSGVSQADCGKAVPEKESPAQVLAASRSREDSSAATGTHQTSGVSDVSVAGLSALGSQDGMTDALVDLSKFYLRERETSALNKAVNEELESDKNPQPKVKPTRPNAPPSEEQQQAEAFEVGDIVSTQFGKGKVEEVGAERVVVKTTEWKMADKQPATLYLQPSAVKKAEPKKGHEMTNEEKLEKAEELKKEGNDHFKKSNVDEALTSYQRAMYWLQYVEDDMESPERALKVELTVTCCNNLSLCCFKLGKHADAITHSSSALKLILMLGQNRDGQVMTALIKRGITAEQVFVKWQQKSLLFMAKAYQAQSDFSLAIEKLEFALAEAKKENVEKKAVAEQERLLKRCRQQKAIAEKKEKQMWQKAMKKNSSSGKKAKSPVTARNEPVGPPTKIQPFWKQKRFYAYAGVTVALVGIGYVLSRKRTQKSSWSAFVADRK